MSLRFSIIIPTLNRRDMLPEALASVRSQKYSNIEIIVCDGGSTDGTIEYIAGQPDIQLLRGPDRGIWDAINKGLTATTGDVVGLLNSDDIYEQGAFRAVADAFVLNPDADAVCGTAVLQDGDRVIALFDRTADMTLTARTAMIGSCVPNARFFRCAAMSKIGFFSLDYKYVADREWLLRWHSAGMRTQVVPDQIYRYRQHPGSLTFNADRKHRAEIQIELVRLARRWRNGCQSNRKTRRISLLLEGRCIATLALMALKVGDVAAMARWLFCRDGRLSLSPIATIVPAGLDWFARRTLWSDPAE